jgi:hypothetical protein
MRIPKRSLRRCSEAVAGRLMVDDRLNGIVSRLQVMGEDYDRAQAEEQRKADEAAERMVRVQRGWEQLRSRRQKVVDEINSALRETGFQLHLSDRFEAESANEIEYCIVSIQGKQHPMLERVRLRVSLKEDGMIAADVLTDTAPRRLKRLTYEEFTIAAWRDLLFGHLELALSQEQQMPQPLAGTNPAVVTSGKPAVRR